MMICPGCSCELTADEISITRDAMVSYTVTHIHEDGTLSVYYDGDESVMLLDDMNVECDKCGAELRFNRHGGDFHFRDDDPEWRDRKGSPVKRRGEV